MIDFYWVLKDKKVKLNDQKWIDNQKENLLPILDLEKKTVAKKRPIEEVNKVIKNVFFFVLLEKPSATAIREKVTVSRWRQ